MAIMKRGSATWPCSIHTIMESGEDLCGLECRNVEETAPDLGRGEAANRKACNNTEIIGPTFERPPEV